MLSLLPECSDKVAGCEARGCRPTRQAPPMVMWTLPPGLLRIQRRPSRLLPHRLLTHHRLPSPTLVLQSVLGRSNQPGGHTNDSGLFRVPPTRFQDPMCHTDP
jgi:hypothetical protein